MTSDNPTPLVPALRFPEFIEGGPWAATPLDDVCDRLSDTVGDSQLTPVSISAGKGFVPQAEKFGRDISGSQYSKYIHLRRGDFAYNRGNSKRFPQGCVYQLTEFDEAAASNAFHCFRLHDDIDPAFISGFFEGNGHGRQLVRHITSGARGNGLLNIGANSFFGISIPIPPTAAEQKKVADCLRSLDDLIAAESRNIEALMRHRQGLMQLLFPDIGETVPRLRFPEFRDAGGWKLETLGMIADISSGSTPARSVPAFYQHGTIPWVKTGDLNNSLLVTTEESVTSAAGTTVNPAQSVLVAMYGGFRQIGRTGLLAIPAATNQALSVLAIRGGVVLPEFVLMWLNAKVGEWKRVAGSSRKDPNITGSDVASFPIAFPVEEAEQRRIAACLWTLDDLLAAHAQKQGTLMQHRLAMLQRLFPEMEGRAR